MKSLWRLLVRLAGYWKQVPKGLTLAEIEKGAVHWTEDEYHESGLVANDRVFVPLLGRALTVCVHPEVREVTEAQLEALRQFLQLGPDSREEISLAVALECQITYAECGDAAASPLGLQRRTDVWKLIDFDRVTIPRHGESRDRYVFVSGGCEWNQEHGLQLVLKNGRLIEVRHEPDLLSADTSIEFDIDYVGNLERALPGGRETWSELRDSETGPKTDETKAVLNHESRSDIRALIELLRDESPKVRSQACSGLARIGPPAKEALTALIALLRDPETVVRDAAARALGRIGPEAKTAIPVFLELVTENDSWARDMLDYLVRRIGSAAIPVLSDFLQDEQPAIRVVAAHALVRIDPSTVSPLVGLLGDKDPAAWVDAAFALTTLDQAAVPSLIRLLENEEPRVRAAAAVALGRIRTWQ